MINTCKYFASVTWVVIVVTAIGKSTLLKKIRQRKQDDYPYECLLNMKCSFRGTFLFIIKLFVPIDRGSYKIITESWRDVKNIR